MQDVNKNKLIEEYWLKKLSGELLSIDIPSIDMVPGETYPQPEPIRWDVPIETAEHLSKVSKGADKALYILALAALEIVLYKYTDRADMVVGTLTPGAGEADGNLLLVRNAMDSQKPFKEHIGLVKQSTLEAFKHGDYDFDGMFEKLLIRRDVEQMDIFKVALIYDQLHASCAPLDRFDFVFKLEGKGGTMALELKIHSPSHGSPGSIELLRRLGNSFLNVLAAIPGKLDETIASIDILGEDEKTQLLLDFNDTETDYPRDKTIHQLFREQAAKNPGKTALMLRQSGSGDSGEKMVTMTYGELENKSERLACYLRENGVTDDTIVAMMVERSLEMMVGIFAILKAGGAYLPILPDFPAERRQYLLEDSRAVLLLTQEKFVDKEGKRLNNSDDELEKEFEIDVPIVCLENERIYPEPHELPAVDPENMAYVIYTSGSTGRPKGVMVDHRPVINRLNWMQRFYPIGEGDVILQKTTYVFDVSVWELFWWSFQGASLCLLAPGEEKAPGAIVDAISSAKVSTLHFVPSMLTVFLYHLEGMEAAEIAQLQSLRRVFSSGEALGAHQAALFNKLLNSTNNIFLINLYGPTEATVDVSYFDIPGGDFPENRVVPIGKPIDNIGLFVVDKNLNPQPIGVPGELLISGDGLARGYLNRPELTMEKFITLNHVGSPSINGTAIPNAPDQPCRAIGGPGARHAGGVKASPWRSPRRRPRRDFISTAYRTGDLARWLPDGNIEYLGRMDFQVKIRGFRIELGEIESRLLARDEIKEVVVLARTVDSDDLFLCAYIVTVDETGSSLEVAEKENYFNELRDQLARHLPEYMVPAYFTILDKMPLTTSGKADRNALPTPGRQETEYTAPRDDIEKRLVAIWAKTLGRQPEEVSVKGNFFRMGGHSLKGTVMAVTIEKEFNVEFPLNLLFDKPTIEAAAQFIRGAEKSDYTDIEPMEKRNHYPLSSAQRRLFFLDQFENIGTSYNMPQVLVIKGTVDLPRIEDAFRRLIRRHESLRTSFMFMDKENQPVQRVWDDVEFYVQEIPADEDDVLKTLDRFKQPFNLTKAPLIRVGVQVFPGGPAYFFFDMHHIIADGTSMSVLFNDFSYIYNGDEDLLPPLTIQYRDFTLWQSRLFQTGRIQKQETYWLDRFADDIPLLNLPTDFPRPTTMQFDGDFYPFILKKEDAAPFLQLTEDNNVTLFMSLLTVYFILIHKYSGQRDMVVGTGIMGRRHHELENQIGMFVNSLALRCQPSGEKSFRQFLAEVRETCLGAFENQDLQFEELVDKLGQDRDASRNPLFDVLFVVQNFQETRIGTRDMLFQSHDLYENKISKFDVSLYAFEAQGAIHFYLEYATFLFKTATIEKMAGRFTDILKQVTANPDILVEDIAIISEEEKRLLLETFNDTETGYPIDKTIPELFREQVEKSPGQVAVQFENQTVTYRELDRQSNRVAQYLYNGKGIRPKNRVGLLMERSPLQIVAIMGILKAGAAYVPIDTIFPEERIKLMIDDSGVEVFLSQKDYVKVLNRLLWECPLLHTVICLDSENFNDEEEKEKSELMGRKLWEYVGETATDEITGGGWRSSYTGEPIPSEEMDQYGDNILKKIAPLLTPETRILEVGCASGISMYRIAPKVALYYGTDLSGVIIEKNKERNEAEGIKNIRLACLPAHEIDEVEENDFDIVIINSVIQCFHGHNYLKKVLRKMVDKIGPKGWLFIGDIMDQDTKDALIDDLLRFKEENRGKKYKTKIDWSTELFTSRHFFLDSMVDIPQMRAVEFSEKIHTLENELTKFRYDALFYIDKDYEAVPPAALRGRLCGGRQGAALIPPAWRAPGPPVALRAVGGDPLDGIDAEQMDMPFHLLGDDELKPNRQICTASRKKYAEDASNLREFSDLPVQVEGASSGDFSYIIYTSGSTGRPKGTLTRHFNVTRVVKDTNYIEFTPEDRVLQLSNYAFDGSVFDIYGALLNGSRLVMLPRQDVFAVDRLARLMKREKVTTFFITAALFNTLVDIDITCFQSVRKVVFGGERASLPHVAAALEYLGQGRLINGYGPTETTVFATTYAVDSLQEELNAVPIGKGISNTNLYVLDDRFRLVPLGIPGELCIGGDGLAAGYLNNPELTHEKFIPNPFKEGDTLYRSGDLVRWREDGNIEFIRRLDTQVKIRGFRIELEEIENRLQKHTDIKETAVIVRSDAGGDNYLCAYIVPHNPDDFSTTQLTEDLARDLPDFMVPGHFVQMEKLPLNPNGKVDKKALPEPKSAASADYVGPQNSLQQQLTGIWSDVLNLDANRIGIDANFFEIGGHSLKATVMMSRIHKEMDVKVQLAEIFQRPTVRGLSELITASGKDRFVAITPAEKRDYYPISPAQKRLYILEQMDAVYNMTAVWKVSGEMEPERVEDVYRQLIKRHGSLRTSFQMVNGEPVQRVADACDVPFQLQYHDLTPTPQQKPEKTNGSESPQPAISPKAVQAGGPGGAAPLPAGRPPGGPPEASKPNAVALLLERFVGAYDLTRAPLLRSSLVKTGQQKYVLMLDMHHIISDGISLGNFITEFMGLYEGRSLEPLSLQYVDYSQWHQEEFQREAIKKQEEFWLQAYQIEPPVLELPYDFPRPSVQGFKGETLYFDIAKDEARAIKRLAVNFDATLYMVVLSLFNVLLSKLSGSDDIVLGSPIAGRRHSDLEPLIGMFVGTLALRNYPAPSKSLTEFIRQVKDSTLAAFDNQDYQFEDLVEKVVSNRDTGRNPLFDIMFAIQNIDLPAVRMPGLKLEPYEREDGVANFDMFFQGFETAEGLTISLNYSTILFKKETVQRFIRYFKRLISAAATDSNQKIGDLEVLSVEEKEELLFDFNRTGTPYPADKTIQGLFRDQVDATPHRVALTAALTSENEKETGNRDLLSLSYQRLDAETTFLASYLRQQKGLKPGDIVALMLKPSPQTIIAILAILKAGAAYLPLDSTMPEERVAYMLDDTGAQLLLTRTGFLGKLEGIRDSVEIVDLDDKEIAPKPRIPREVSDEALPQEAQTGSGDLSYIIYTSGTTGKPKGTLTTHANVVRVVKETNYIHIQPGDRVLQLSNVAFDGSVFDIYGALLNGANLVMVPPGEAAEVERLALLILRESITVFFVTTALFNALVDLKLESLAHVGKILFGGERASVEHGRKALDYLGKGRIVHVYGPTETTVYATYCFIDKIPETAVNLPIGKPIANTSTYILDNQLKPVPIGVAGEIHIGGYGVAKGYLNRPQLTAEKFIPNPFSFPPDRLPANPPAPIDDDRLYRSGDLARWSPQGEIEFLGRIDFQVKIRGFRIELGEIESRLMEHSQIDKAVVVAGTDNRGDMYLCAYISGTSAASAGEGEATETPEPGLLKDYLAQTLPDYMIPPYWVSMTAFPLTPNGKVDRKALPKPDITAGQPYAAPSNDVEKELVNIWAEILGLEAAKIGIDFNFFQMGGQSLKATMMVSHVYKALNARISLAEIFKHSTIRGLARVITAAAGDKDAAYTAIERAEKKEYYPLSSAQKRLYVVQQITPDTIVYNMPMVFLMDGELDCKKLENAFRQMIARHESLRTSLETVNRQPVQRIYEASRIDFKAALIDLTKENLGDAEREAKANRLLREFIRPFDLTVPSFLRVGFVKTAETKHIVLADMHHVISDGLSHGVFLKELLAIYRDEPIAPLKLQYKDFSQWQNGLVTKGALKKQEEFWMDRFQGHLPVLNIPFDFTRPAERHFQGERAFVEIPKDQAEVLRAFARDEEATMFMVMLAVFNVLLARLCRQEDVVLGVVVAGRRHPDLDNIIGMFVNTLALRNYPEGEKTFIQFLKEVRQRTLEDFDNQDFQFEDLVEKVVTQREPGRNPLFDILFSFMAPGRQETAAEPGDVEMDESGLKVNSYGWGESTKAKFDILFSGGDTGDNLYVGMEYGTELFKKETIQRFLSYFQDVVTAITTDKNTKLKDITISHDLVTASAGLYETTDSDFDF